MTPYDDVVRCKACPLIFQASLAIADAYCSHECMARDYMAIGEAALSSQTAPTLLPAHACVYVIGCENTARVKIGYTQNLRFRINTMQTGCPYPLLPRYIIVPGTASLERALHKAFDEYRVFGEWFDGTHVSMETLSDVVPAGITIEDVRFGHAT